MTIRRALSVFLITFLLFPFLFLIFEFNQIRSPAWGEIFWAFKNSFIQAFFSALFSVSVGLFMALGLTSFSNREMRRVRVLLNGLCLAPNLLPPLFILLSVLNAIEAFPMGLIGVIFIHTLMNAGLVAVLMAQTIEQKLGGLDELSYVEGASRRRFILKGLLPSIRSEILFVSLFVFTVCFSSFSVPLVVGGGRGTTLEVLIYEKMRLSSDWSGAVLLALIQSVFIFGLALMLKKSNWNFSQKSVPLHLAKVRMGILPILLISFLFLYGYFQGLFFQGVGLSQFYDLKSVIFNSIFGSLWISLFSGFLVFFFLLLIAYCWPQRWLEKFLNSYVAPSTALACFAILISSPNESFYPFLKIPLAFLILNLTSLHRLGWANQLEDLRRQCEVAQILGSSYWQIFRYITLPQVLNRSGLLAGIAAVWACGDFAISRVLAHRDVSLAMVTDSLMSSYRLHQAAVLSLSLIVISMLCYGIILGVVHVLRRKLVP